MEEFKAKNDNDRYPSSDTEAIKWVEDNIGPEIRELFDNYYKECCEKLKTLEIVIPEDDEFNKIKNNLKDKINKEEFKKSLKDNVYINEKDIERIERILENNNQDKINKEDQQLIIKMWRHYNMFLKYGHSAKATWVADHIFNNILNNAVDNNLEIYKDGTKELKDELKILKKIILTAAFLHDIGRFYQAINYNDLFDGTMKNSESKISTANDEELDVDHAVAGYYFSVASSFLLNEIRELIDNTKENFIIETLTALVVRFHSKDNSTVLDKFGTQSFSETLAKQKDWAEQNKYDESSFSDVLFKFIKNIYESMGKTVVEKGKYAILLPATYKEFVNNILTKTEGMLRDVINNSPENLNNDSEGFVQNSETNEMLKEINGDIETYIRGILNKSDYKDAKKLDFSAFAKDIAKGIIDILKNKLNLNLKKDSIEKQIEEIIKASLDYDIALKIDEEFSKANESNILEELSPLAKYAISASMTIVTDSDKIDILDQRAKGIYNSSYIMESIKIYPPKDSTLFDILENYFKFKVKNESGQIVFDELVINFINNNKNIKYCIGKYLNISMRDELIIKQINFNNEKGSIIYSDGPNSIEKKVESEKVYTMFNVIPWYDIALATKTSLSEQEIAASKTDDNLFKEIKIKNCTELQLSISRDVFEENISGMKEDEQIAAFKKLVFGDSQLTDAKTDSSTLAGRFKLEAKNQLIPNWIFDATSDQHLVPSPLSGLIWHLNQYIFVNMRNVYSLEIIRNEGILDNILKRYEINAKNYEPYENKVIKEYIDYAKGFIDYVLNYCHKYKIDVLEPEFLTECRKGYESEYISEQEIKNSYN